MTQDLTTDEPTTYYELDDEGRTQEVCMLTGKILNRALSPADLLGGHQVEKAPQAGAKTIWGYHEAYGQIIADLVTKGKTIEYISGLPGMPKRSTISNWQAKNDSFRALMDQARKDRAEVFHDEIVKDVDEDHKADKDEVQARKLKLDRLKWLASKGDPERFGDRTKVSGDSDAPLQIIVSTGIIRKPEVED